MDERNVVTCFLRNDAAVLLLCRSEDVGSYRGQWGTVAGHAEGDPDAAARREISEETGLDDAITLLRRGDPFAVEDPDRGTRWIVHPYLFESDSRTVEPNWETSDYEWVHPTEIRRRETVPDLWTSYDRVRPTVETIESDRQHGSAWLSIRALEVLRDEAGGQAGDGETAPADGPTEGWRTVARIARRLRDARPSMPVVANRVNGVMATAERTPEDVERTARDAIADALAADQRAARTAADRVPNRVVTLSRSGTVRAAIKQAEPNAVLVAESRPGREGVGVAESLADETDVTLSSDAGLAWAIHEWDGQAVVVGADAIEPDGTVLNKVGTRVAALAANYEAIDVLVVAAVDKVASTGEIDVEEVASSTLYEGDVDLSVAVPLFDKTPPDLVDLVATERGVVQTDEVAALATRHREQATWDETLS
ncbi:MAG: NUDIX domain-containing protein [Halorhabdus sp.]